MGKAVLFVQQKGGAGKTMLLTQLAVERAGKGAAVTLIDLDPQRSTATWFGERSKCAEGTQGITLVESAEWRASSDIRDAVKTADWVFIDAPGSADVLGKGAMRAADYALIPCQPAMADVWASRPTLEMAVKERLAHGVVFNRFPPRSRAADAAAANLIATGAKVLKPRVGQRSAFAEAFMQGAGVTETAPRSKAADEIKALFRALSRAV